MAIKLDRTAMSEDLGVARPVKLPATRYRQGGREMFHVTVAVTQLPQIIVKRPDPDHPIEGNRKVDGSRAKRFGSYVIKNEDWVSPAIIVRAPSGEIEFEPVTKPFDDGTAWGELTIPLHVLNGILLLDGQHRTLGAFMAIDEISGAIRDKRDSIEIAQRNGNDDVIPELERQLERLLATRERLTKEHISVDIAVVTTDRAKQMFADINNNAKGVNPDYTTLLDQRYVVNRIAVEVMEGHPLLKDRVEFGQSRRMSSTNPNLMGAKTVADIVRTLHVGISGRIGAKVEQELSDNQVKVAEGVRRFLDVLVAGFEDLQAVIDGDLDPVELRGDSENRSMIGSATMLRALAGAYHDLTRQPGEESDPEPLGRSEIEVFFRALAPKLREIPIAEDDAFWLPTEAFIPGTSAPQARAGTMRSLVDSLVEWAREGNPKLTSRD
jgi:DGQHR domain-containing protein